MKTRIIRLLYTAAAVAVLGACTAASQKKKPDYTGFQTDTSLQADGGVPIDTIYFRYPYRVEIKDSLAIVLDLHNDTHYLYAFTYPGWRPIAPLGKRGEGPDEMLMAERARICSPDSVWVLDSNRRRITRWQVSVAERCARQVEEIPLDERLLRTLDFCKVDGGFLVTDYTGKYRYHRLGMDGRIVSSEGSIPASDLKTRKSLPALAQAWRSFMSYNPRNGVLAMVTQLGEVLEIFNTKTGFHAVVCGPGGEPVFSVVDNTEAIPKGIKGFNDVLVTDSCVYTVFDGTTFEERLAAFHSGNELPDGGKYIYVFSLGGKPLRKLKLDHSVFGICRHEGRIYLTSTDTDCPVLVY